MSAIVAREIPCKNERKFVRFPRAGGLPGRWGCPSRDNASIKHLSMPVTTTSRANGFTWRRHNLDQIQISDMIFTKQLYAKHIRQIIGFICTSEQSKIGQTPMSGVGFQPASMGTHPGTNFSFGRGLRIIHSIRFIKKTGPYYLGYFVRTSILEEFLPKGFKIN